MISCAGNRTRSRTATGLRTYSPLPARSARNGMLAALREIIANKHRQPINQGNRKVIVFTAFADTANYLFEQLAPWARETLGWRVRWSPARAATRPPFRGAAPRPRFHPHRFSPRSKERPEELASEGDIDLLSPRTASPRAESPGLRHWSTTTSIESGPHHPAFRRIDRIGSPNERIQLRTWPNMELEETSTSNSGSADAWCCSTSRPRARRT